MSIKAFLDSSIVYKLQFSDFLSHPLAEEFINEYRKFIDIDGWIKESEDLEEEKAELNNKYMDLRDKNEESTSTVVRLVTEINKLQNELRSLLQTIDDMDE